MSAPIDFASVFTRAGNPAPYAYQCRLACGSNANPADATTLAIGIECRSLLISIPTGLGKTAAVVLAWLWNRVLQPDEAAREQWPRRLVYCLPMRTLVEQTADEVKRWLNLADTIPGNAELQWLAGHSPIILMGGADSGGWDIHPERPAILIGTQDMLLSRALNRGYGATRARWPMHFGLLNNDALWVLDETQLMGVGVRTSAQLEGLRRKLGTALGCATWWASATLDTRLLVTPDHRDLPPALVLNAADKAGGNENPVNCRIKAVKRLDRLALTLTGDSAKLSDPYVELLAQSVADRHQEGRITIVILNRVGRAQDLYAAFEKLAKKKAHRASLARAFPVSTDGT